jgi:hypothetical protein
MAKKRRFLIPVLLGILALIVLVNTGLIAYSTMTIDGRIAAIAEAARPAKLQILTLLPANCPDCASLSDYVDSVKQQKVTVASKTAVYGSADAAGLPSAARLPALIISGEIAKTKELESALSQLGFVKSGNFLVLASPVAPYFEVSTSRVRGIVSATAIESPECSNCAKGSAIIDALSSAGVYFSSQKTVSRSSTEGADLISKYNITKLPAMTLSGEFSAYPAIVSAIGAKATNDGQYVYESVQPIYFDLIQGKPVGEVQITFVNDTACATCFDVTENLRVLPNYGLTPSSSRTFDISSDEGKALLSKYNITKVPTFLLSADASLYSQLVGVWPSVGTVETDGTLVFRNPGVMGTYKDLATGQTVAPQ